MGSGAFPRPTGRLDGSRAGAERIAFSNVVVKESPSIVKSERLISVSEHRNCFVLPEHRMQSVANPDERTVAAIWTLKRMKRKLLLSSPQ